MTETVHVNFFAMVTKFWFRKIICLICLQTGVFTVSYVQPVSFLPFSKLEIKNGLPGINVRKITRDPAGFMWFATQDGLSRFDGHSYINLNSYIPDKKRRILGTDIFDIRPGMEGKYLWALTSYGGLNKIDLATCNVVSAYQVQQTVKPDTTLWYKCFFETPQYLVIGTNEGIISRFKKSTQQTDYSFDIASKFGYSGQLEDIFIDAQHRIWFLISGQGILVTDSSMKTKLGFISSSTLGDPSLAFTDYAVFKNSMLITTTAGLKIVDILHITEDSREARIAARYPVLSNSTLYCIAVSGPGAVIGGKNMIIKLDLDSQEAEMLKLAGNFEDQSWITLTNSVYLTGNSVWIGSQYGVGWIRNMKPAFVPYYSSFDGNNIKIRHAITLCAASDSLLLVCGDDGLYSLNHRSSQIRQLYKNDFFYSVFPGPGHYFIASGVASGLILLTDKLVEVDITLLFPELKPIRQDLIMCSEKMGDSLVFMASQNKNGLYIWNTVLKKLDIINTRTGKISLRNDNINRLYLDSRNKLWIVCENVISIYDPLTRTISHLPLTDGTTNTPLSINMDVCETKDGYWLTSYGTGLVEISKDFKVKKIYRTQDGINNLGLYKIFNVNDSLLIASSNNGLSLINSKTGAVKNYFGEDGLQSNSFEEASGYKLGNYIFLGGINGITRLDISRLNTVASIPQMIFSTITLSSQSSVTDTLNIHLKKLIIPTYITQLTINFSALNYSEPEKIKYAYRILEKDKTWNYTRQSFFQSFRLDPGTYHLQVQALNEDGFSGGISELELVFRPHWYQTWPFKLAIFLLFIACVYILYRMRIGQLRKEQAIRSKLASDLHDDLGSTLNSVKVYTNLALMEKNKEKHLPAIKENIQEAITSVKDMIWILDDSKDTIEDLLLRISRFASALCEACGIHYTHEIADNAREYKLPGGEKRNLYMILKEAVNNSCKYSEAAHISIVFELEKKKPVVSIRDDGKGFDNAIASEGNGLKNIRLRASQIHYQVTIQSSVGNGTLIRLEKI